MVKTILIIKEFIALEGDKQQNKEKQPNKCNNLNY